jgi:aspartate/methionine/tyrosine aminotransferase
MRPIDLTFGNPGFLQEILHRTEGAYASPANADYDQTVASAALKDAIYALHERVDNVLNVHEYDIVIGNGASQLLTAISTLGNIGTYAPFWSRFDKLIPQLIVFTNEWSHQRYAEAKIPFELLVTYPNNPNGALSPLVDEAKIVDASYHWPTFYRPGEPLKRLSNDVILFSFSKLTGLSSTRLGWALVKKPYDKTRMQEYVEVSTCGVNVLSQQVATQAIDNITLNYKTNACILQQGQSILNARINAIAEFYPEHIYGGHRGMFLYVKEPGSVFDDINVKYVRGTPFGGSHTYVRLNLGCTEADFNEVISRLSLRRAALVGV